MKLLKKIDKYILYKFLSTFLFFILMMSVIICVIDYTQKIDDFVKNNAPTGQLLIYFSVTAPSFIVLLFPLFVFLSTIYYTSRLAYRTEIVAILSAGVSYSRFLKPFIIGGLILAGVNLLTNHYLTPKGNVIMNNFLRKYFFDKKVGTDGVHLKLTDSTYLYIGNFDFMGNTGNNFTYEKVIGTELKEKWIAHRIEYKEDSMQWVLGDVVEIQNDGIRETLIKSSSKTIDLNIIPDDLDLDKHIKMEMTTPELLRFINREKERGGDKITDFEVEYYRRSAQAFATFLLVIIGVSIASKKTRGGSGFHLAVGIAISALYVLTLQLTSTFSINSGLHPVMAVWIPNFIFMVLTIYLYRKRVR
ncbi:MAG TPA: LptF/LptG family permease [Edaphocola sp.]|nr:LptF/LptG family permease [Edaphocola sp.]